VASTQKAVKDHACSHLLWASRQTGVAGSVDRVAFSCYVPAGLWRFGLDALAQDGLWVDGGCWVGEWLVVGRFSWVEKLVCGYFVG
jgi:hypothetical protein